MRLLQVVLAGVLAGPAWADTSRPRELIDDAKALLVVGACGEGAPPAAIRAATVDAHCKKLRSVQGDYKQNWVAVAREFFAANVPKNVPKVVVYPFAGGDLATALTVYPDADEITTLSLEPAGDPRALARISDRDLKTALGVVAKELGTLYRANFSVTMNMIFAMRGGQLPTQLIFGLSALSMHGYEPVSLRYFKLTKQGDIVYLSDEDFAKIDALKNVGQRNRALSNIELRFRKSASPGFAGARSTPAGSAQSIGQQRQQVYRHIMANLDDAHLKADPSALAHLEKKGKVAGMTKAASYLLTFDDFSTMRKYIIDHVVWMVSDSTGLPPSYGTPAGFEYETHGTYELSNMAAGATVTPQWRALYKAQPKRPLKFRFGYPDKKARGHLIIMRKKQ